MSLLSSVESFIKKEKTSPERVKKEKVTKSSNEILSELFGVFNAAPPKIDESSLKKSKKSKKKHKKEKKRTRNHSSSDNSEDSDREHKHKKKKKHKSKKVKDNVSELSLTPPRIPSPPLKYTDKGKVKIEVDWNVKKLDIKVKREPKPETKPVAIKTEDASLIPMPDSPQKSHSNTVDLRTKLDNKKTENTVPPDSNDKSKSKIQIKNLKFSTVFEETLKKAEEEARKRAEKYEEGEYTHSSSSSEQEEPPNAQFPKSADPGGILKQSAEDQKCEDDKHEKRHSSRKTKTSEGAHKSSKRKSKDRSRSRRRSRSRSKRRSRSRSRRRHKRSHSRSRHRSRSRSRNRTRRHGSHTRVRRLSRSPTGVRLGDSEKRRLLEVARRNAINMLKNGAVPAAAAALPPHTRNQVMAAIQSGGKSVDELTDFCKHLSKKEALGELSSVSSNNSDMSDNEDTLAFHHPFLVKEKAPIVMNIRGGAPLPTKLSALPSANKDELRIQFPVSSGSQHRDQAIEWRPVTPPSTGTQVAKVNHKHPSKSNSSTPAITEAPAAPASIPALPAPVPPTSPPAYMKSFTGGSTLSSIPALTVPGPQAYPPGVKPPAQKDIDAMLAEKLSTIRRQQELKELCASAGGFTWSGKNSTLGQFTGSTGVQILTPRELASGSQAWAKKDQLVRAAPVEGGMGMHLLQKMGWTPGRGLGKEGTGALQPLLLEVKLDTRGLQAKEEMKPARGGGHRRGGGAGGGAAAPVPLVAGGKHPVSLLGEYCSKQKLGPPEYNLCFECGPDHKKNFLFKVRVAGVEYQPAVASANKKQAKADAAQIALQKLGILPP